jgi:AcrR family transcriptional regulator
MVSKGRSNIMDNMTNKYQELPLRGRPLSSDVTDAVFTTALEIVGESGLAKVSRREIAARAGVSRQTLYNRWPSVGDIVLEALLARAEREIGTDDGGGNQSPRTQLRNYVSGLAGALNRWAAPCLVAVAALAQQDAAFAQRFRERFLERRHQRLVAMVAAACSDEQDATRIAELIAGSMWYRLMLSRQPLDAAWIESMVALVEVRQL